MLRERLPLLRCFDQPLQHGIGVHLKPPRRAADAQAFREAREHAYDELNGGAFAMEEGKVGLHGGYALQEHRAQAVVLLGRRGGYCPSDDGEGEERQGGILLDEPVHRCLERAARAGRRRVSRMGRRGQIRGDPVCQGAPASRTGSPCLGPCARKGKCFDMVVVGGVYHRRHHTTPCPSMLSIRHGGCLLRTCQSAGTGGVEEGQSSLCSLIMKKYPFLYQKRKTIIFMVSIKKNNN
jgi:hypothetical protein